MKTASSAFCWGGGLILGLKFAFNPMSCGVPWNFVPSGQSLAVGRGNIPKAGSEHHRLPAVGILHSWLFYRDVQTHLLTGSQCCPKVTANYPASFAWEALKGGG